MATVTHELDSVFNGAVDATGGFKVNGTSVINSSGVVLATLDVTAAGTTTGIALALDDNTGLTTGKIVAIASSATAITTTGRLFSSVHSGATGTSATLNEFSTAANDETVLLKLTASAALALGTALNVSVAALTTGTAIKSTDNTALTTGILLHLATSATAITGAGRLFYSNHTGATGTSAILNEFASAANDETVLLKVTASAALALGVAFQVSGAAITTGTLISANDANALTTGGVAVFASNSADTGTRSIVQIKQDHASASGATALEVWQDGALAAIKLTGNPTIGIDFTALANTEAIFNATAATGCTAAPQTNAAIGFIKIKVAGTDQWIPYYDAT